MEKTVIVLLIWNNRFYYIMILHYFANFTIPSHFLHRMTANAKQPCRGHSHMHVINIHITHHYSESKRKPSYIDEVFQVIQEHSEKIKFSWSPETNPVQKRMMSSFQCTIKNLTYMSFFYIF